MLEKENLTPFQIQLLLYYLTAEPSQRTVTDSARSLNVSKWVVTRTLDTLEKLNIVERLENRKTVLTVPGVKLAEKYQKQRKVLEKYMQYQDIPPAQIKENALRALAARFSDEFMDRLAEQESRMHIKEIFAGRRDFHGGDICNYLSDGSYYFPFIIYREQIKNHNNLSMANRGFENPCEVIVKDHEGLVYLAAKTVSAQSMSSKNKMEGRIQKLQYLYDGEFRDGGIDGRYVFFPVTALRLCRRVQLFSPCSSIKTGGFRRNEKFFGAVLQQCWFISHDRGLDAFLTLQQAVWSSFATENPLTTKW